MAIKTRPTSNDIRKMIAAAPCLRDKLIISFYANTGCRCSELLALQLEHIDLESGMVIIPHLKRGIKKICPSCHRRAGRRQPFCSYCGTNLSKVEAEGIEERKRLVSIGPETVSFIREYLEGKKDSRTGETRATNDSERLIPLTRQAIYYIVRDIAKRAGLTSRVLINPESGVKHYIHPHSFRDALASDWLEMAGTDASKQKALQDHLGHRRFDTTMRYHKLTPAVVRALADEVRKKRFPAPTGAEVSDTC